jgi:tetratricopeptide (TPR) repeat protein
VFGSALSGVASAQGPAAAPAPAPAAAPAPAQASEYDDLVLRALTAYDAGRWDEARGLFERAHALDPTARTLRTIGMAAFNQGDLVAALQNLEAALVDSRKPLTDEQRTHVLGLIERANRQVGRYRLRLQPAGAALLVDGKPPALVGSDEVVMLSGHHELRLSADGYAPQARALDVQAQDRAPLEWSLAQPAGAVPEQTAGATQPGPVGGDTASVHPGGSAWPWVAFSIGAAGLITSGVTFGLALHDKSALDKACDDRHCPPSEHDTISRYDTLRVVSGVTLGVGLAGAAAGVILSLSDDGAAGAEHAGVAPLLGPGFIGARGRW